MRAVQQPPVPSQMTAACNVEHNECFISLSTSHTLATLATGDKYGKVMISAVWVWSTTRERVHRLQVLNRWGKNYYEFSHLESPTCDLSMVTFCYFPPYCVCSLARGLFWVCEVCTVVAVLAMYSRLVSWGMLQLVLYSLCIGFILQWCFNCIDGYVQQCHNICTKFINSLMTCEILGFMFRITIQLHGIIIKCGSQSL